MKTINIQQELKFIHLEKISTSDKESLSFQLLNVAQTILPNYANAETKKLKSFYKIVYQKIKSFYLERFNR